MDNTKYAGDNLFGTGGKLDGSLNFQIGSSTDEALTVNVKDSLDDIDIANLSIEVDDFTNAQATISGLEDMIANVGTMRSALGANINRLGHTAANLANMQDNTDLALSNIQDADYATEASSMTRNQLLVQTSMSMLKTSNSMSSMVTSLLG